MKQIIITLLCATFLLTNCKEKKKDDVPGPAGNENKTLAPMPMNNITMGSPSLGSEYANRILLGKTHSRGQFFVGEGQDAAAATFNYDLDLVGMFLFDGTALGLNVGTVSVNDSILPWDETEKYYSNDVFKTLHPVIDYKLSSSAKINATGSLGVAAFEINVPNPLCSNMEIIEPENIYKKALGIKLNFKQPILGADSINTTISTTNNMKNVKRISKSIALGATIINFTPAELTQITH